VSVYRFDHVYKFMFHERCPCEFNWFSLENLVNTHHLLPFILSVEASMLWVACHSWSSDQKELPHRSQLLTKILLLNVVNLALIFTILKPQTAQPLDVYASQTMNFTLILSNLIHAHTHTHTHTHTRLYVPMVGGSQIEDQIPARG
jgi:hypothetical protein